MSKSDLRIEDFEIVLACNRDHPLIEALRRAVAELRPIEITIEGHRCTVRPFELHQTLDPGKMTLAVRART